MRQNDLGKHFASWRQTPNRGWETSGLDNNRDLAEACDNTISFFLKSEFIVGAAYSNKTQK